MIVDHWFQQVDKILKAMEITSGATKMKLATFQLNPRYVGIGSKPQET